MFLPQTQIKTSQSQRGGCSSIFLPGALCNLLDFNFYNVVWIYNVVKCPSLYSYIKRKIVFFQIRTSNLLGLTSGLWEVRRRRIWMKAPIIVTFSEWLKFSANVPKGIFGVSCLNKICEWILYAISLFRIS